MSAASGAAWMVTGLILAKWAAQEILDWLNRSHVATHRDQIPKALEGIIDEPTYRKAAEYTLAKSRLEQVESGWSVVVLLVVLFSGVLPWAFNAFRVQFGSSAWATAALLFLVGVALSLTGLPFEWYHQF